ncbi:MAG: O-antigen ligase family protein, partial [Candidatus Binatia bacterium]
VGIGLGMLVRPRVRAAARRWRIPHSTPWLIWEVGVLLACLFLLLVHLALTIFADGPQFLATDFHLENLLATGVAAAVIVWALRWRLPYMKTWLLLGLLVSLAYLYAPLDRAYLTSPVAPASQLYRYCWRPILFYPLAILLLTDRKKLDTALLVIVLAGVACAVSAFSQGYSGAEATGPFVTKNQLGGALIIPILLAVSALFYAEARWLWRLYAVSAAVIARGLLFAGSRGAFVAVLGGATFFVGWLLTTSSGRAKTLRFAVAGALLVALAVTMKPDLWERPTVRHLLTTRQGMHNANMQWRLQERWPYFWERALSNFWLGTGTDVDTTLGDSAVTPHNGYLGIAVVSGVPSLVLVLVLALQGVWNGVKIFRRGQDSWQRSRGLALAAAIVGILIHNIVDETFRLPFAGNVFWICVAATAALTKQPASFLAARAVVGPRVAGLASHATARLSAVGAKS